MTSKIRKWDKKVTKQHERRKAKKKAARRRVVKATIGSCLWTVLWHNDY